jgi:hypothetical protein
MEVHDKVGVPEVSESVIEVPLPRTFELASYAVTDGEVPKALPLTAEEEGCVVKAREFSAPGLIVNVETHPEFKVPSVARIDWTEVFRTRTPENEITPEAFEGVPVTDEVTSVVQFVSEKPRKETVDA